MLEPKFEAFKAWVRDQLNQLTPRVDTLEKLAAAFAVEVKKLHEQGGLMDQLQALVKPTVIKFRKLESSAVMPQFKSSGAAGMDLCAIDECGELTIEPGRVMVIRVGLAIELPPGFEAQVRSRSGLAARGIVVANSPGTIDSDYQGEIGVILHNTTRQPYTVRPGDRIAQLVIAQTPLLTVVESTEAPAPTERGAGGFGSTGK